MRFLEAHDHVMLRRLLASRRLTPGQRARVLAEMDELRAKMVTERTGRSGDPRHPFSIGGVNPTSGHQT